MNWTVIRSRLPSIQSTSVRRTGIDAGLRGRARDLIGKKCFPIAVHQRGRMLPTVLFFLPSPASVISFP